MLDREVGVWSINDLLRRVNTDIVIPKEHTAWGKDKEERLIDSLKQGMDIGAVYLWRTEEGLLCLDGFGRINAIKKYIKRNDDCFVTKSEILCSTISVVIFNGEGEDFEKQINLQCLRLQLLPIHFGKLDMGVLCERGKSR